MSDNKPFDRLLGPNMPSYVLGQGPVSKVPIEKGSSAFNIRSGPSGSRRPLGERGPIKNLTRAPSPSPSTISLNSSPSSPMSSISDNSSLSSPISMYNGPPTSSYPRGRSFSAPSRLNAPFFQDRLDRLKGTSLDLFKASIIELLKVFKYLDNNKLWSDVYNNNVVFDTEFADDEILDNNLERLINVATDVTSALNASDLLSILNNPKENPTKQNIIKKHITYIFEKTGFKEKLPPLDTFVVNTANHTKLLGLLKASQGVQHGATETYRQLDSIGETEGINAPSWRWKFQSADVTRSAMEAAVDDKINKLVRSIYGIDDVASNLKRRRETRRNANNPPEWDAMYPINREDYRQRLGMYKPQQKPSPYLTPGQQKPASGASTGLYGGARRKSTKATKARKVTKSKKSRRRVRK